MRVSDTKLDLDFMIWLRLGHDSKVYGSLERMTKLTAALSLDRSEAYRV